MIVTTASQAVAVTAQGERQAGGWVSCNPSAALLLAAGPSERLGLLCPIRNSCTRLEAATTPFDRRVDKDMWAGSMTHPLRVPWGSCCLLVFAWIVLVQREADQLAIRNIR